MPEIENTPPVEGQTPAAIVPPSDPAKPHVLASSLPDDALKARLDAAKATGRAEFLRELGVTDTAQLKSALEEARLAAEARKTESEKFADLTAKEQQARAKLNQYEQAILTVWDAESARLTPEQSKAVTDIAGDDVALRVRTLNALRQTWSGATSQPATPAPAAPGAAPVPPAAPPAADTSPAPNAPPATILSPTDPKAVYDGLKKNPIAAANYAAQHPEVFS